MFQAEWCDVELTPGDELRNSVGETMWPEWPAALGIDSHTFQCLDGTLCLMLDEATEQT